MSEIVPFTFEKKPVRILPGEDGETWFVAPDACRAIELSNVTMALRILDDDEKGLRIVETPGGNQEVSVISEPGLYKLLARSHKPEARRFDRWVRHEVLPSIRKHGAYIIGQEKAETREELLARAMRAADSIISEKNDRIAALETEAAAMKPDVEAFARIGKADGSLCITDAAKTLQMRPKDLFIFLRREGWIYTRAGGSGYLGYQARVAARLVEHKTTTITRSDGSEREVVQVRITAKGLARLAAMLATTGRVAA